MECHSRRLFTASPSSSPTILMMGASDSVEAPSGSVSAENKLVASLLLKPVKLGQETE